MKKFIKYTLYMIILIISCEQSTQPDKKAPNFAMKFDGIDDFIEITDSTNALDTGIHLTIEAWFQSTNSDSEQSIVMHGFNDLDGKNNLLKIDSRRLRFNVRGLDSPHEDVIGETPLQDNKWYHGAFTYDGTNGKLFLNGMLEAILYTEINMNMNSRILIGTFNNPRTGFLGFYFSGVIDEVRIWNVIRSQKEISSNMGRPLTGHEDGLVAYYSFDEGYGQIIIDHAGNNNGHMGCTYDEDECDPAWLLTDFPNIE